MDWILQAPFYSRHPPYYQPNFGRVFSTTHLSPITASQKVKSTVVHVEQSCHHSTNDGMLTLRSHAKRRAGNPKSCSLKATKASGSLSPSAANRAPPEILLIIFALLSPRDFDNARRACSQWMRVSLNREMLEIMLKRSGWWNAWQQDCSRQQISCSPSSYESEVWRMSKRFATECLLSGRKANFEKSGFRATAVIDFGGLSQQLTRRTARVHSSGSSPQPLLPASSNSLRSFNVSGCGGYVVVTSGHMIHTYRLDGRKLKTMTSSLPQDAGLTLISSISCSSEVLSATLDTSTSPFVVAALLRNRVGMVCDLDYQNDNSMNDPQSHDSVSASSNIRTRSHRASPCHPIPHYFYDICSEDHPPQTMAICPGRRCLAFGCAAGIEVHWFDQVTQTDQRKNFPMAQPSEVLHFLSSSPEDPHELRLISSLAGPGVPECACRSSNMADQTKKCQFNFLGADKSFRRRAAPNRSSLSLVRATHCHHYRAVPINDGYHMIFVEPRTGLLCIGSDAPLGGPTSLNRAFVCVPPFEKDPLGSASEVRTPTAFVVGSDLSWGLRVVAAYNDRLVLYSIPLDVFNVIRSERERQAYGLMGDNDLARDWFLDSDQSRKNQESLVQNQNGDWDFLLSVSYRATAMMWPFKIYGKEIGHVHNLVDLSLQTQDGGARVWAFNASGKATVFDLDTLGSPSCLAEDALFKRVAINADGSPSSVEMCGHKELDDSHIRRSKKRKADWLQDGFAGRYGADRCRTHDSTAKRKANPRGTGGETSHVRQPSFAACIVDFKIPKLGKRKGPWKRHLSS